MSKKRQDLIEWLRDQPTYDGRDESGFERNVKLHHINVPDDIRNEAYELVGDEIIYDIIDSEFLKPFAERHLPWEIQFAGRSGGHLVMCAKRGQQDGYWPIDCGGYYHKSCWSYRELQVLISAVKDFNKVVDDVIEFFFDSARLLKEQREEEAHEAQQEAQAAAAPAFGGVS